MTLNEIHGMKAIMPKIDRSWVDQIIVVDGRSTDGTIEWAKVNNYQVYVQKQKGFRHAYNEVWPHIIGDIVIFLKSYFSQRLAGNLCFRFVQLRLD